MKNERKPWKKLFGSGLIATVVFTILVALAPSMGLPKMDIVGILLSFA